MNAATRGFTAIPNIVIRDATIPAGTKVLYGVIMSYAWSGRACTASADTLCSDAAIGRTAFFEGIALLRDRGLLEVQKRKSKTGWHNVYVPVAKGVTITDLDEDDPSEGRPDSERRVVRQADVGSSATRTQKKTKREEDTSPDGDVESDHQKSDEAEQLCDLLAELVIANDAKAKVAPASDRWRKDMRLLLQDRDGDQAEVEQLIRWSQADPFWKGNILSPSSLRKNFTRLLLGSQRSSSGRGPTAGAGGIYDRAAGLA